MFTELAITARRYNRMLWALKGCIGQVQHLKRNIPSHYEILDSQVKLTKALENAKNQLEYCEYLVQTQSLHHRNALKKESP